MELAKRCPTCGGKPQYVHYCTPGAMDNPDGIYILLKRLECKDCGASVAQLVMTCDDAVKYWNGINEKTGKRFVLQRAMIEDCPCEEEGEQHE